jgi:hypothetical protein
MAKKGTIFSRLTPEMIKKGRQIGIARMEKIAKGTGHGSRFARGIMEKHPSRVADVKRGVDPRIADRKRGKSAGGAAPKGGGQATTSAPAPEQRVSQAKQAGRTASQAISALARPLKRKPTRGGSRSSGRSR